ncbi:malate dehydrogenase [Balamuthia mandrillaris]
MEQTQPERQKEAQYGRVEAAELRSFVERCALAAGCPAAHAKTFAEVLVLADLRGVHSHGVNRLQSYIMELKFDTVDKNVEPKIVNETVATACVDGQNGMGSVIGKFCMELAMRKAKEVGVGWVVARNGNHYGIAGYYAMLASQEGLIGMSYCNTSPAVFPTRSACAALGTNPIAVAAPSQDPKDPFVLDMATSAVALGKVEYKQTQGLSVPFGWGCDAEGKSTTDARTILDEGGGLRPLGGEESTSGYKGYGLAMMVEIFCGILSGSNYGPNIPIWRSSDTQCNLGLCFVAVDPSKFNTGFEDRMSGLMQQMRELPPSEPDKPVLVAGDPEKATQEEYTARGIALHNNLIQELKKLAETMNVEPLPLLSSE